MKSPIWSKYDKHGFNMYASGKKFVYAMIKLREFLENSVVNEYSCQKSRAYKQVKMVLSFRLDQMWFGITYSGDLYTLSSGLNKEGLLRGMVETLLTAILAVFC